MPGQGRAGDRRDEGWTGWRKDGRGERTTRSSQGKTRRNVDGAHLERLWASVASGVQVAGARRGGKQGRPAERPVRGDRVRGAPREVLAEGRALLLRQGQHRAREVRPPGLDQQRRGVLEASLVREGLRCRGGDRPSKGGQPQRQAQEHRLPEEGGQAASVLVQAQGRL